MADKTKPRTHLDGRRGLYLVVAGALLIVMGLAVAMTAVSSPPGNPAPLSIVAGAGLVLALAITGAGIATLLGRGYWLAEAAAFSLVLLNVGYGVASGTPERAVGGIITAMAVVILVRSGRSQFGPALPGRSS